MLCFSKPVVPLIICSIKRSFAIGRNFYEFYSGSQLCRYHLVLRHFVEDQHVDLLILTEGTLPLRGAVRRGQIHRFYIFNIFSTFWLTATWTWIFANVVYVHIVGIQIMYLWFRFAIFYWTRTPWLNMTDLFAWIWFGWLVGWLVGWRRRGTCMYLCSTSEVPQSNDLLTQVCA
jgi:hypothetical protein